MRPPGPRIGRLVGGVHEFPSPVLTSGREFPGKADTVFCASMTSSVFETVAQTGVLRTQPLVLLRRVGR
jgi:hypothetical protein